MGLLKRFYDMMEQITTKCQICGNRKDLWFVDVLNLDRPRYHPRNLLCYKCMKKKEKEGLLKL